MNKEGRPLWIPTPEILEKAKDLAALGMTQEQIAYCLGIHPATLFDKKNKYPEFADAINEGTAIGIANVTAALMKNVDSGNVTSQIFYLKCKAGWKETTVNEVNVIPHEDWTSKIK